jgi:fermentation-respiration switch protein FrsA (DUF1100 family)
VSIFSKGFYIGRRGVETRTLGPGKIAVRVILAVILVAIVMGFGLWFFRDRLIYYPRKGVELSPASIGWEFHDLYLSSTGGNKINAWYLPLDEGRETVLLLHGNGGNLTEMMGYVISYHKLGFGVMAIDYQGFGNSQGKPSEEAIYEDADVAFKYLTETEGIPPDKIIIHGFSLGGGAASWLALKYKDLGSPLILDSTFTSLKDAAKEQGFLLGLVADLVLRKEFDTYSRIPQIKPSLLLVFHSPEDETVAYSLGRKNYEAYHNGPKEFVNLEGGHLDYYLNQETYAEAIQRSFPRNVQPKPQDETGGEESEGVSEEENEELSDEASDEASEELSDEASDEASDGENEGLSEEAASEG